MSTRPYVAELLERAGHLSALAASLDAVRGEARGRVVLVGGEAGVGKSTLLRRFCDEQSGSARVLWGSCAALFTPRPLGPLIDIAASTGGELEELVVEGAKPYYVAKALLAEIGGRGTTIVVLEDLHWADEATLDVLTLLGRGIAAVRGLVLASYRDDELARLDPLRVVIGELGAGEAIVRLHVDPLSAEGVAQLAGPDGVDPDALYRATGGNPFFVTEVLAAAGAQIPQSVRDAVLARTARLSAPARELLEAVAVVPRQTELWLLEALAGDGSARLEECLASGMLTASREGVGFRHELARQTIEETLSPDRRALLHRAALAALLATPSGVQDLARIAHHAEAAGAGDAVLRFAPAAAERAALLGAHREAAAQYRRALRFAESVPLGERAELLDRCAHECDLTNQLTAAAELRHQSIECHRSLGDSRRQANALSAMSWPLWVLGRTREAEQACLDAVALLESLPPGSELARAHAWLAWQFYNASDREQTVAWGASAATLAEEVGDLEAHVMALTSIGAIEYQQGVAEGRQKIERSLELAKSAGLDEGVGMAYATLVHGATRAHAHAVADRYLDAGMAYCREHDLDSLGLILFVCRAELLLDQGRWDEAADALSGALLNHGSGHTSVHGLASLGRLRARRGDPGQWAALDEALAAAEPRGELVRLADVATARAEAAWLEGRHDAVAEATESAFALAKRLGDPQTISELAYWRWRAGIREPLAPGILEPRALQIAGDWAGAAEQWSQLNCPYEAALALADADEDDALRRALADLQRLDARPAAAIVARRLRARGVRGLPRGPRASTRENPAGLTAREVEVLRLVADGLRNAQIAERLFLAEKTVGHHVAAILRKLDVHTRSEAAAEAGRLGLLG